MHLITPHDLQQSFEHEPAHKVFRVGTIKKSAATHSGYRKHQRIITKSEET